MASTDSVDDDSKGVLEMWYQTTVVNIPVIPIIWQPIAPFCVLNNSFE